MAVGMLASTSIARALARKNSYGRFPGRIWGYEGSGGGLDGKSLPSA